ncbi:NTP pyrophosphohydrolase [Lentzea sp. NPDC051838]|uniref:NTP pyrophosphohydrolase n=1 Tax=Lentzea sp. NPDC051838 TaxID=3154849 RepID=UPI00343D3B70
MKPLLVVDAANVVGSVPDGWWRDRAGAAERLRDALQGRDEEVVLVVEGKARNVSSIEGVRVVAASGDGDDTIVEVVRSEGAGRVVTVVTADRELRRRVTALGAEVAGPTSVPRR